MVDDQGDEMGEGKGRIVSEDIIFELIKYLDITEERQKEFKVRVLGWLKKNEFLVRRGILPNWAHVVQDFNKSHIYKHYAKQAGFEDTPVHGTLVAAYYEDYILDFLDIINGFTGDKKLYYTGQVMKFRRPLYPRRWSKKKNKLVLEKVVGLEEEDNKTGIDFKIGIDLTLSVIDTRRKPEEQIIISNAKASFRYLKEQLDHEYINSFLLANDIVERNNIEITKDESDDFYKCRGKKPRDEMSMMYAAALGISTILKLSSRETGKPKGTYRNMKLKFYAQPKLQEGSESIFRTVLRMPVDSRFKEDETTKEKGYAYRFKALILQERKPVLEGIFNCFSKDKF